MSEKLDESESAEHNGRRDSSDLAPIGHRWYAVQCLVHREATAASHLENQGFETFLPRRRKTRRHARKFDIVLAPFFPGYLFVKLDTGRDRWRSINGTRGVARLVMAGDGPAPAPIGIVETLKSGCDQSGVLQLHDSDGLQAGRPVCILSGAFAGLVGELDRLDESGRVRVLLDIMGGRTPVMLPRESVVRATVEL